MNEKTLWTLIWSLVILEVVHAQPPGLPDLFGTSPPETIPATATSRRSTPTSAETTRPSSTTSRTRRTAAVDLTTTVEPVTVEMVTELLANATAGPRPSSNADGGTDLVLQACCGNRCVTFDNLMSMVGLQCCGDAPINAFEKICCSQQIHQRHAGAKYFDRCCEGKPYAWDQVCCRGKVYDGVPQASCCGELPYSIYDRTSICCGEQLHKIPPNTGSAVCCGESMYDDRAGTHFCCGDRLYSRATHNGCCHPYPGIGIEFPLVPPPFHPPPPPPPPGPQIARMAPPNPRSVPAAAAGLIKFNIPPLQSPPVNSPFIMAQALAASGEKPPPLPPFGTAASSPSSTVRQAEGYNSTTQMCCDRVYDRREYDFCCYVVDVNAKHWTPPMPRPYSSKTHCCDGTAVLEMIEVGNKTSCAK